MHSNSDHLFDHLAQPRREPLASRMRPRHLDEIIGQSHIIGPGRLLRRAILADQISSLIFFGPPGTGKTTLARVIAEHTKGHFMSINAVLAGVGQIRECIDEAQRIYRVSQNKSILFVDEVHRFNRSQQDALLPHVENGTIILIGATTENPFFEVNKALVSRSRIFELKPLDEKELELVATSALSQEKGYGHHQITFTPEALQHLIITCNGDARTLLNAIELAVEPELLKKSEHQTVTINLSIAEESIQKRAVLYDRDGDAHYDVISAFIKSMRGSDPDAALYWLAKMVYAGEDPHFILRRMIIAASEDVGLANPQLLTQVMSCAQAFDVVGMPEGQFHLTQACLLICNSAKSNSTLGYFDALKTVNQTKVEHHDIPLHLKDSSRDGQQMGHGKGYRYPHAFENHWVAQHYLPEGLQGKMFYYPSNQGEEGKVKNEVQMRREACWAAFSEPEQQLITHDNQEQQSQINWTQRSIDNHQEQLSHLRDLILEAAHIQRDNLVLDLNAKSGLLTLGAARAANVGGVHALCSTMQELNYLQHQSESLTEFIRPIIHHISAKEFLLTNTETEAMKFNIMLMRQFWEAETEHDLMLDLIHKACAPRAKIISCDIDMNNEQRLWSTLEKLGASLKMDQFSAFKELEEQFFKNLPCTNPWMSRDQNQHSGFVVQKKINHIFSSKKRFESERIHQWFSHLSPLGKFLRQYTTSERCDVWANTIALTLQKRSLIWKRHYTLTQFIIKD